MFLVAILALLFLKPISSFLWIFMGDDFFCWVWFIIPPLWITSSKFKSLRIYSKPSWAVVPGPEGLFKLWIDLRDLKEYKDFYELSNIFYALDLFEGTLLQRLDCSGFLYSIACWFLITGFWRDTIFWELRNLADFTLVLPLALPTLISPLI